MSLPIWQGVNRKQTKSVKEKITLKSQDVGGGRTSDKVFYNKRELLHEYWENFQKVKTFWDRSGDKWPMTVSFEHRECFMGLEAEVHLNRMEFML